MKGNTNSIEEFIPKGYENRISRWHLCDILHMPDREIRKMIADAAERGVMIYSVNGGYFRRKNKKDDPYILEYIRMEENRFKSMSHKRKLLKKEWDRLHPGGQMSLF